MAYMNQEKKAALAPQIKAVLKKYGMKGSIAVRHHSTLVVNVREGKLDVIGNFHEVAKPEYERDGYLRVNEYHAEAHYSGEVLEFIRELLEACNKCDDFENYDKSDAMTDYFNVGWYVDINVGQFDKPYKMAA